MKPAWSIEVVSTMYAACKGDSAARQTLLPEHSNINTITGLAMRIGILQWWAGSIHAAGSVADCTTVIIVQSKI